MTGGLLALLQLICGVIMALLLALPLGALFLFTAGGASFGREPSARFSSRLGFTVMLSLLAAEWGVFQFMSGPRSALSSTVAAGLVLMVAWSFAQTAFTDPGTPASPDWQNWEGASSCRPHSEGNDARVRRRAAEQEEERLSKLAELRAKVGSSGCSGFSIVALLWQLCVAAWRFSGCETLTATPGAAATTTQQAIVSSGGCKKRGGWTHPGETTYCEKCACDRPARSHHCKCCGLCVMQMDHHCPLIGNCVGRRNLKQFVVLQWWQLCACLMFLLYPNGPWMAARAGHVASAGDLVGHMRMGVLLYCSVAWAGLVLLVSARALVFSVYMAAINQTTIESLYDGDNPYRLPTYTENLRQAFGPLDLMLLLPLEPRGGIPAIADSLKCQAPSDTGHYGAL